MTTTTVQKMSISLLQENLARGLAIVGRAIHTRGTMPIMQQVLLEATEDGWLRLAASNLEYSVLHQVGAKVSESGACLLPWRDFHELVNTLPKDRIDFALDAQGRNAIITCGRTKARLPVLAAT